MHTEPVAGHWSFRDGNLKTHSRQKRSENISSGWHSVTELGGFLVSDETQFGSDFFFCAPKGAAGVVSALNRSVGWGWGGCDTCPLEHKPVDRLMLQLEKTFTLNLRP